VTVVIRPTSVQCVLAYLATGSLPPLSQVAAAIARSSVTRIGLGMLLGLGLGGAA
jgi:hypothetical protein